MTDQSVILGFVSTRSLKPLRILACYALITNRLNLSAELQSASSSSAPICAHAYQLSQSRLERSLNPPPAFENFTMGARPSCPSTTFLRRRPSPFLDKAHNEGVASPRNIRSNEFHAGSRRPTAKTSAPIRQRCFFLIRPGKTTSASSSSNHWPTEESICRSPQFGLKKELRSSTPFRTASALASNCCFSSSVSASSMIRSTPFLPRMVGTPMNRSSMPYSPRT